ncbi:hypothetical protein CBR_g72651 [Chara braunii]|uniref:WRC domain-containing protein n=1 Tax=Chara braunii TaxID=69332 RepID=A0A388KA46_CHABU|nr:hypothetical protein CBR_g72651 [Chara braunii]|eukprot:GBG66896.1 hypothetical protein CBR_g72651 [Chara braunii]
MADANGWRTDLEPHCEVENADELHDEEEEETGGAEDKVDNEVDGDHIVEGRDVIEEEEEEEEEGDAHVGQRKQQGRTDAKARKSMGGFTEEEDDELEEPRLPRRGGGQGARSIDRGRSTIHTRSGTSPTMICARVESSTAEKRPATVCAVRYSGWPKKSRIYSDGEAIFEMIINQRVQTRSSRNGWSWKSKSPPSCGRFKSVLASPASAPSSSPSFDDWKAGVDSARDCYRRVAEGKLQDDEYHQEQPEKGAGDDDERPRRVKKTRSMTRVMQVSASKARAENPLVIAAEPQLAHQDRHGHHHEQQRQQQQVPTSHVARQRVSQKRKRGSSSGHSSTGRVGVNRKGGGRELPVLRPPVGPREHVDGSRCSRAGRETTAPLHPCGKCDEGQGCPQVKEGMRTVCGGSGGPASTTSSERNNRSITVKQPAQPPRVTARRAGRCSSSLNGKARSTATSVQLLELGQLATLRDDEDGDGDGDGGEDDDGGDERYTQDEDRDDGEDEDRYFTQDDNDEEEEEEEEGTELHFEGVDCQDGKSEETDRAEEAEGLRTGIARGEDTRTQPRHRHVKENSHLDDMRTVSESNLVRQVPRRRDHRSAGLRDAGDGMGSHVEATCYNVASRTHAESMVTSTIRFGESSSKVDTPSASVCESEAAGGGEGQDCDDEDVTGEDQDQQEDEDQCHSPGQEQDEDHNQESYMDWRRGQLHDQEQDQNHDRDHDRDKHEGADQYPRAEEQAEEEYHNQHQEQGQDDDRVRQKTAGGQAGYEALSGVSEEYANSESGHCEVSGAQERVVPDPPLPPSILYRAEPKLERRHLQLQKITRQKSEKDGGKCKRSDGKGWRCPIPALKGQSFCSYHLKTKLQASLAKARRNAQAITQGSQGSAEGLAGSRCATGELQSAQDDELSPMNLLAAFAEETTKERRRSPKGRGHRISWQHGGDWAREGEKWSGHPTQRQCMRTAGSQHLGKWRCSLPAVACSDFCIKHRRKRPDRNSQRGGVSDE